MNCKPGDIARIVGPLYSPNIDRIVRCVRLLAADEEMDLKGYLFAATPHGEFWAVEGRLVCEAPGGRNVTTPGGPIGDKWLRPIRDPGDDVQDEMLRPLPEEVTA